MGTVQNPHSAHLLIVIDITQTPPAVVGAQIMSCGPDEVSRNSSRYQWAEITRVNHQSYQEALDYLNGLIRSTTFVSLRWIVDLLEKTEAETAERHRALAEIYAADQVAAENAKAEKAALANKG